MTRPDKETPKGWAAVPGTSEKAPIIEIVVLVVVCAVLLGSAVGAICGFLIGLARAF